MSEFSNLAQIIAEIQLMTEVSPESKGLSQTSNYKVKRNADQLLSQQDI